MTRTPLIILLLTSAAPACAQSNAWDDDIVVTASRSGAATDTGLIGSSVTVLDNQDLEDRGARVLSDALRDVPGVEVNRSGAIGDLTDVFIRGAEANQTLVFIDGIKADDPYFGQYDFGTLLTDEAARVEVLRGQQSALYGSDAIGGVISYSTLTGRELPGVTLRAEGGSQGTYDGGARIAGVSGGFDYALSGSLYHTDGYPIAPGGTLDTGSDSLGASGKFDWKASERLTFTAVGRYSYTRASSDDQNIAANSPVVLGYPVITTLDTPGNYGVNRGWYGLVGANWTPIDALTTTLQMTLADTTRNGYDYGAPSYGDHGRRWRGSFTGTWHAGNEHIDNRLTLAVDAERQDFRNTTPGGFSDDSSHRIDTMGYVMQDDAVIDQRLALSASARIDANSQFADDSTYRVTASYRFPQNTRIHAAYGTGVKDPSATDLYDYATGIFVGNPALRPEQSRGWEAGVEQRIAGERLKLGATYFDSLLINEIDTTYTFANGNYLQTPYNNPVHDRQRGVETYASARLTDWRLDLAYTWLDAPQTIVAVTSPPAANGAYVPPVPVTIQAVRRPGSIASLDATWAPHALPVTATVTVRYNGRQNDYAFDANYDRLIVSLKPYTLVGLNATWQVNRRAQLFGRVENLLGENYQEVFTYAAPARTAYAGVRLKL